MSGKEPSGHQYLQDYFWKDPALFSQGILPPELRTWILLRGSFTEELRRLGKQTGEKITVKPLREDVVIAKRSSNLHECLLGKYLFSREIQLFLGDNLVMYARSFLSTEATVFLKKAFRALGDKPLGSILFKSPDIKRGPFELARIPQNQHEYELCAASDQSSAEYIWARRSLFSNDKPLLSLIEFFSPSFVAELSDARRD